MFNTVIRQTPFTTEGADEFFPNITGGVRNGDVSWLATVRAVIGHRKPADESINIRFGESRFTAEDISGFSPERVMQSCLCSYQMASENTLYIHGLVCLKRDDNNANFEVFQNHFLSAYPGWYQMEPVTAMFRRTFNILCFVNAELHSTILIIASLNNKYLHYAQAGVTAYFPWYYKRGTDTVSQEELDLLRSFSKREPDDFYAAIRKLAEGHDFESARIRRLLSGFESQYEKEQLSSLQLEIERYHNEIRELNDRIAAYYQTINERSITALGLEAKIAQGGEDSEIMNYVLQNKEIDLVSVDEDRMKFIVRTHLAWWDEDMARRYIENHDGFVYSFLTELSAEQMEKLMKAVFLDQKIKVRFCAAYEFRISGNVRATGGYDFGGEYNTYMPNPHIDQYSCMGGYERKINRFLESRDYIGALEQTCASARSLNWGDSTVMRQFFRTVCHYGDNRVNNKAFELPDGTVVDPKGAVEWLEKEEAAGESSETQEGATENV